MFRTTLAGLCIVAIAATTSTAFGQSGTRSGGGGGMSGSGSRSYAPAPSYNARAYSSSSYGARPYSGASSYNHGGTCNGSGCSIQSGRQVMYSTPVYHSAGRSSCGSYSQPSVSYGGSSCSASHQNYAPASSQLSYAPTSTYQDNAPVQINGSRGTCGGGSCRMNNTYQPDHSSIRFQSDPSSSYQPAPQAIQYNAPPIPDSSASLSRPNLQQPIRKAGYQPAFPGAKAFVLDTEVSTRRSVQ